jgi:hypothetical protein
MPNYAVQRRRGTTAEHASFTGLAGELTVDTTKDTVVVHDGSTAGGIPLATEAYANTAVSAADLDLTTDSGTIDIDLDSETLTVAGGAGITTSATSTTATVAMDYTATWAGNLLPDSDNTRDLGSNAARWKDIHVGPGSLYVNGKKVIDDESGQITMSTDDDENLIIKTGGTGDLELFASGTGVLQAKGTFQIQTTKRITDSAGTKVEFGDAIDMTTNKIINVGAPASATDGATKGYVDTIAGITPAGGTLTTTGDLTVTGDLLVSGDTVTVNVATLAIEDAMVELASGNTGGATSYIGMKAERGSAGDDSYFVWEESSDKWRATTSADGVTHADANMQCGTLTGTATAAQYSDLAERYETDQIYTAGTVVCFGGSAEITQSTDLYDSKVCGIISANPAHLMNAQAGTNETHPAVALTGRVPCKVMGTIRKGDLMVTSAQPGVAMSADERVPGTIIGKAIQDYTDGGIGVIEILVTLM